MIVWYTWSNLSQKHPQQFLFPSYIPLIPDRKIHPGFLVDNAAGVTEGFEAFHAVVSPHSALTDTAKWHGAGSKMDDGVVDAAAAEVTQIQYFFLRFFVFAEEI